MQDSAIPCSFIHTILQTLPLQRKRVPRRSGGQCQIPSSYRQIPASSSKPLRVGNSCHDMICWEDKGAALKELINMIGLRPLCAGRINGRCRQSFERLFSAGAPTHERENHPNCRARRRSARLPNKQLPHSGVYARAKRRIAAHFTCSRT